MGRTVLILTAAALLGSTFCSAADQTLLDQKVPRFAASNVPISKAVTDLAAAVGAFSSEETVADFDPKPGKPAPRVSLTTRDKTVRELLDSLVAQDSRYAYSVSGKWINVFPASTINDPNYVFNRRMPGKVTVSTSPDQCTDVKDWVRQIKIAPALLLLGDMKRKLPVEPQTVTLENPTHREYMNWSEMLKGHTNWFACSETLPDGTVRIMFHYSTILPSK
jgi:hypothetical protein